MRLRTRIVVLVLVLTGACSGCATNTGRGALAGGGIGALTGAAIGSATGRPGAGAALGAGIGALTGGAIGNAMDEQEKRSEIVQAAARNTPGPMSIYDVVNMARNGVGDDLIISQIHSSGSSFTLSPDDIVRLRQEGVSEKVVQTMMNTPRRPVVIQRAPVYVVDPYPPPPVHFGIGYHFHHRPRCW